MKQVFRNVLPLMGVGMVFSLLAAGCATSSDVEKLDRNLSHKMDAQSKAMRSEVNSLHEQVKNVSAVTEGLRTQVRTFQLDTSAALELVKEQGVIREQALRDLSTVTVSTRRELEGYGTKAREHFGKIEEMTGEVTKQIRAIQQVVSGFSGRIDQLPPLVSALGTEVRSLTETLLGSYELEEVALRDRLRAVEEMKKRLRPLEARQSSGSGPEK
ncbi:MAG: hypothetical protein OJF52_004366 [Nitrospira sp.]|jgi:tRNA U55 pseudouridine synthase TruB|nr:MAG: hypothetical protein OJF52_004366 [Nitrospira sp.]